MYLYSSLDVDAERRAKSSREMWALLGATEAGFVTFFVIFVTTVESKYRASFFSTITAKQFRIKAFREAMTDKIKMNVMKLHPSYYKSIRGEVEQWVRDNYNTWDEEKPEWFTERVKQRIPEDMIPENEDEQKQEEGGIAVFATSVGEQQCDDDGG